MKDTPKRVPSDKELFGRRKMLSALSIAGLSAVSGSAIASQSDKKKTGKNTTFFFYANVSDMKQDTSLKEGCIARTSGYYTAGDNGAAEYLITNIIEKPTEGEYISLKNDLTAMLINVRVVNYKMFGAKSDGKNDDGIQIKAAHDYANKKKIPVENLSGDFWIENTNNILIQTDTNWGKSTFHINEKYNSTVSRFRITGQKSISVNLSATEKQAFLEKLKSGAKTIPELAKYANSLIVITDSNDKTGARQGGNAHEGKGKQEFFYVEEYGRIIGDIFLDFSDYTSLAAHPAEESYLTVEGGTFFLTGEGTGEQSSKYMANGIQINRSRTIIRNQWVGLKKGNKDTALRPRSGFYSISTVYDLQIENIRLIPWEKSRGDQKLNVPQGTYGISGRTMMNVLFRNITAEGDDIHWGVFGTNYVKNLRVERCFLNRFDVHSFGWNIVITDSEIGAKGITVTGGGELRIENTTCFNNSFITFRRDYGAKWDGNILLKNCKLVPSRAGITSVLQYGLQDLDYKYAVGYGHKIKIENFIIDYKNAPDSKSACWIINASSISSYAKSGKLFFPSEIEVKNVSVAGRSQGVRIMKLSKPNSFVLQREFFYDSAFLSSNTRFIFENIYLEKPDKENEPLSHFAFQKQEGALDNKALVPFIRFKDCENIICNLGSNLAEVEFESCSLSSVVLSSDKSYKGSVLFKDCKLRPFQTKENPFEIDSELGTGFVNCILLLPEHIGDTSVDLLGVYKFIEINKTVRFSHLNTRLGKDVISYCKKKGITLLPKFIDMLKSHHELESVNI